MKTDIEICKEYDMRPISEIGYSLGITDYLEPYGKYKAKINESIWNEIQDKKDGKLILVSATSPGRKGIGKTTVSIGLSQAFNKLGRSSIVSLREPSLGPVFGMKGGAAGGGYSQVVPMEDINLHFTGDMHAITSAHNLVAAQLDNILFQEKNGPVSFNITKILWTRCLDVNDRALRCIQTGLGGINDGVAREASFEITAASELMAILCLATDMEDLKSRLRTTAVAIGCMGGEEKLITLEDIGIVGSVAALLKEAIKPNLVQTLEGTPALIHGGPFANIAHGCSSVAATNMAKKLCDVTITEAGFGSDMGLEKFMHIKGAKPDAIVIVTNMNSLARIGVLNLRMLSEHIDHVEQYGVPFMVLFNSDDRSDSDVDMALVREYLNDRGVPFEVQTPYQDGGDGCLSAAMELENMMHHSEDCEVARLYNIEDSFEEKVEKIFKRVYGAGMPDFSRQARMDIERYRELFDGFDKLSVCVAKSPYSVKPDRNETGWVDSVELRTGAGYVTIVMDSVMRMPGLAAEPNLLNIDVIDGEIVGLS